VKVLIIGCGRVGSTVAKRLAAEGWEVTAIDEKEGALSRLGEDWTGGFVEAGIDDAEAVVVATDGDNTNIVIGQVAQKRFGIDCTVVRILDPARAEFYRQRGLRTVCPTSTAIDVLTDAVRSCEIRREPEATPA
jgi:trk system potassium uptake protein